MTERHQPGFTLVELLVVMTIIALAMVAIPAIVSGVPSMRLRTAADGMVATLRELHQQAIRRGKTTELVLDPAARAYRVSADPAPRHFPEIVAELGFEPTAALLLSNRNASIRFFADGSASGGTLFLKNGERVAAIKVDWLTGRVRRDE